MRRALAPAALAAALVTIAAAAPRAQLPFDGKTGWSVGPTAQAWSFGCCSNDTVPASLKGAQQFTLPLSGAFAIGKRVLLDGYVAYVMGNATMRDSGGIGGGTARVNGFTDMTVRAGIKLHGDDAMITAGVNLPTGLTDLYSSQFTAMRVLGAPVLAADVARARRGIQRHGGRRCTRRRSAAGHGARARRTSTGRNTRRCRRRRSGSGRRSPTWSSRRARRSESPSAATGSWARAPWRSASRALSTRRTT